MLVDALWGLERIGTFSPSCTVEGRLSWSSFLGIGFAFGFVVGFSNITKLSSLIGRSKRWALGV